MVVSRRGWLRLAGGAALAAGASRSGAAEATETTRSEATEITIGIDNFSFSPPLLSVAAGTGVTWANHDDIPHSIVCPALGFHSHVLDTDETFLFRFAKPGSFDYFCSLHPHMKGTVTVASA